MVLRQSLATLLVVFLLAACATPSGSANPAPSSTPTATVPSPSASVPLSTPSPTVAPPSPSPTPAETMIVGAYFFLDDAAGGDPALVPVLRTVPKTKATAGAATARAAMTVLLAGPSDQERAARPRIGTIIPAGTELLGIQISDGVATVDLSGRFASGGGSFSVFGRLAQVVYTMTQFSSVDRVRFELDGEPVTVFSSEGIILDKPVSRATYRDEFLPAIFVDRPAWGAELLNPGRVTGLANVFEAQFRIALLDRDERVLVDRPVLATCGTGCWGSFDVTLEYGVPAAQWGTLRVWDPSERDGRPENVREYPVYLRPTP